MVQVLPAVDVADWALTSICGGSGVTEIGGGVGQVFSDCCC